MVQTSELMVLNKIPVTPWVCGTAEKMRKADTESVSNWNRYWLETYHELGGASGQSGSKGCPRAAAYGLWYLGRVQESGRAARRLTVHGVRRDFGKNAAYAVIAADLLEQGASPSAASLWPLVQARFSELTGEVPADSEQGEIKLVVALFCERQLVVEPLSSREDR